MGRSASIWLSAAAVAAVVGSGALSVQAADLRPGTIAAGPVGASMTLECDNGRTYPIRPRAVSDAGELVTGYLYTAPRRAQHFRLVPMGTGYRYAGYGFWFDGIRSEAMLEYGRTHANCTVVYS